MATISATISNILNMIDHQPVSENNSCLGIAFNFAFNYRKLLAINATRLMLPLAWLPRPMSKPVISWLTP